MADIVYLVCSAAPPVAKRGRLWGRVDPGIEPVSLNFIPALANLMWRFPDTLTASQSAGAIATAKTLADPLMVDVRTDPDLAETDFGELEGCALTELWRTNPELRARWRRQPDQVVFPGGEAMADFFARSQQAWRRSVDSPEPVVAVVTHPGIISHWCCLFLALRITDIRLFRAEYASITAFQRRHGDQEGWEMVYFNNSPFAGRK